MQTTEPVDHELPGYGWTIPKLAEYVEHVMGHRPSRNMLRALLKKHGMSWKKIKKVLAKAKPEKRQAYIEQFRYLFEEICQQQTILIYIDEVHIHRDLDLGYTWSKKGEPAFRLSQCAPLSDRINWYGAYHFNDGQCFIWNEGNCNKEHTSTFLDRIAEWLGETNQRVVIILDGAPWHRANLVKKKAEALHFDLVFLPGYSPDLNPIEGLWKWMREEVTQCHCYKTMRELFLACIAFIQRINLDSETIVSRLWPIFELNPDTEKLLVS